MKTIIELSNDYHDKMFKEDKRDGKVPDWWEGIVTLSQNAITDTEAELKELRHHKDTTVGLYATDKDIEDLLYLFWQRSSDACPLEVGEAEEQEKEFAEWVKDISWRIK